MTASTADILVKQSGTPDVILPPNRAWPVAASTSIPAGCLVGLNASGNAGNAEGSTFTNVVGVCERAVDNSAGGIGAKSVTTVRGVFAGFGQTGTTIDKEKVGSKVYAVDNQTLSLSSSGNAFAGYVDDIKDGVPYYSIAVHVLGS